MKLTFFLAAASSALIALGAAQADAASYNYVQNGNFEDELFFRDGREWQNPGGAQWHCPKQL